MLKKILEIKKLGIFDDYLWNADVEEFRRFNIIYGWNGSGKTTLSYLFSALETGISTDFPELEYKIQFSDKVFDHKAMAGTQLRVFNKKYIEDNIDIISCKAKSIFILGKINKELSEEIKKDEIILNGDPSSNESTGKIRQLAEKKDEHDKFIVARGKIFSDVAKNISIKTSGVLARNYRKNNAEQAFSKLGSKQILSDDEIGLYSLTLQQLEKTILPTLSFSDIDMKLSTALDSANALLRKVIKSKPIEYLMEHTDISHWVEKGLEIHEKHGSIKCEFCENKLNEGRIILLRGHFNDDDKKLKSEIDGLLNVLGEIKIGIDSISAIDKANLYEELQNDYSRLTKSYQSGKEKLIKEINLVETELQNKKNNTTIKIETNVNANAKSLLEIVNDINQIIDKNNGKSRGFNQSKVDAVTRLENHYLSEIIDEIAEIDIKIESLKQEIAILEHGNPNEPSDLGIEQLQARIAVNKSKIATSGPACEEMNTKLHMFLGNNEIRFEVIDDGYLIKRRNKIAKNLSEGEKTAIAFVYFIIHLNDKDFDIRKGIIVIDDPICSLDSNSLFQAFAFLKNAVTDAGQVIIFTHNFDFMKLLINWLQHFNSDSRSFFMIKNPNVNGTRQAHLSKLDTLLEKYESEYQYLVSIIMKYKPDGTIESVYHLPNIARKVLEYFLLFAVPNSKSLYIKLDRIDFDKIKKTSLYKFVNDQSHITGNGFEPSLIQETQKNISYLLEMIKKINPTHFQILEEIVSSKNSQ